MAGKLNPRIMKEIKTASESDEFDFFMDSGAYDALEPGNCYLRWTVKSGLYEGQTHVLQIRFIYGTNEVKTYPRHPPNVLFLTPIWHTNVSSGGGICVDILRDDASDKNAWSPLYGICTIFNSILVLLEDHNTGSAYNGSASSDYKAAVAAKEMGRFREAAQRHYDKSLEATSAEHKIKKLLNAPEFSA